ncbi:hypothetical protein [Castellaniella sp. GW247-6E4]|uniref:hypothetical protein n=1 Tax=Castellaniella sp. GW247-6E4 TaxID=3140380 RepID=UPI003315CD93
MTAHSTPYYDPPVRFREVYTRADIDALVNSGQTALTLGERGTITDEAREHALKLGIVIQHADQKPRAGATQPRSAPPQASTAPVPARVQAPSSPARPAAASPAGVIDAVVAELHARGIAPSAALVQDIVAGVNGALAPRR